MNWKPQDERGDEQLAAEQAADMAELFPAVDTPTDAELDDMAKRAGFSAFPFN